MSVVTDIIITFGLGEEEGEDNFPAINDLNAYLEKNNKGKLNNLGKHGGGYKVYQCEVFGGAFNYLDIEEFARVLKTARWSEPESVSILIQGEGDEIMREVLLLPDKYTLNLEAEKLRNALK